MRTETTINNTRDFGIGKLLKNLPALRQVGFQANRRLLDVQTVSHDCAIGEDAFDQVVRPTLSANIGETPDFLEISVEGAGDDDGTDRYDGRRRRWSREKRREPVGRPEISRAQRRGAGPAADPEVPAKAKRRQFSPEYKQRMSPRTLAVGSHHPRRARVFKQPPPRADPYFQTSRNGASIDEVQRRDQASKGHGRRTGRGADTRTRTRKLPSPQRVCVGVRGHECVTHGNKTVTRAKCLSRYNPFLPRHSPCSVHESNS